MPRPSEALACCLTLRQRLEGVDLYTGGVRRMPDWLRAQLVADPDFGAAWNNLAVVLAEQGHRQGPRRDALGGCYSLAIDDGRLVFAHNGYGEMTVVDCGPVEPGRRTITLDVVDVGDVTWEPRVLVDGDEVGAAGRVSRLMAMAPFEGIDIGIDRRSPVNWDLYERKGPARFTGTIQSDGKTIDAVNNDGARAFDEAHTLQRVGCL